MKNILVPTDFSINADLALDYAGHIAKKLKGRLTIVHCCDLYQDKFTKYRALIREHNSSVAKELFKKLDDLKTAVESLYGIEVQTCLYDAYDTSAAILQASKDHPADMIVMGTYGTSGLRRKFLGSKTTTIINESDIPVLTIPPDYSWARPKTFLLAVEEIEDASIVTPVFELARLLKATVDVVVFSEEQSDAFNLLTHTQSVSSIRQKLERKFKDIPVVVQHLVGQEFRYSLQQFISERKVDLLSLVTHKRGFMDSVFNRSITQTMSYHSEVPLLCLHCPQQ